MSTLKSSIAKAVAAVIALSAGSSAFAAIGPNEGPSDLYVAVWNPATLKSYVADLGSSFSFTALDSGAFNTNGFSTSTTIDGGNLATDIGAGTYTYALFAGDLTVAGNTFQQYLGNTWMMSQNTSVGTPTAFTSAGVFNTGGNGVATYIDIHMNGGGVNNLPATTFLAHDDGSAGSAYWAATSNVTSPGANFGLQGYNGAATGAGTLNLTKYFANDTNDGGTDPDVVSFVGGSAGAGIFSLNDTTGVLSYQTPVPLPAAAWLLVSGLLGLGAVGRRKGAAAVAV